MEPFRISVIGIDGSGKSTTTLRAIHSLSHQFQICKTGRNPFFTKEGNLFSCLPKIASFFENLFKKVDQTKKRSWIGLTRLLFVFFQGWLEPYMIQKYHPELIMTTRCMIIDSAIYSDFYYPRISQTMTIETKLKLARIYSRLPFRNLYFFLDTPIKSAMERIYKRISDDHPDTTYGRDYWLHLHEHEEALQLLDRKFRQTLEVAQKQGAFNIVEISTSKRPEQEVASLISELSTKYIQGYSFERWERI